MENVVSAIEQSLNATPGTKVRRNAMVRERATGLERQVDIYVEIPATPRVFRVAVEVRDEKARVDLPEIESLIGKLQKIDVDRGCIVSQAGFTENAERDARRNGIELRTLASIEAPEWWRATVLEVQGLELIHSQVNFRREDLAIVEEVLGADHPPLSLTLENGENGPLLQFIAAQGEGVRDRPEVAALDDQSEFNVEIDLSQLRDARLSCANGDLPFPTQVLARFRVRKELVPLSAFRAGEGDTFAFTGLSEVLAKQATLVAQTASDGSRKITYVAELPNPPKVRVDPPGKSSPPD